MRHTRCHTRCYTRCHTRCGTMRGTMRGMCQIAGEAPRAHRCSTGKTTSALACPDTVETSAARASGRMAVRHGGKACEGGQCCESRRAGPERAARPTLARRRSFAVCLCPLRALWQVRSLCFPQGCSRATAAACQLAIALAMTARDPLQVRAGRKSISCLSISARVRRFAAPGKSR